MKETSKYEKELTFLKKCLDYSNITYYTYTFEDISQSIRDLGIRRSIGLPLQSLTNLKLLYQESLQENTLCYLTDEFGCHYVSIILPETSPRKFFTIGPYIRNEDMLNGMLNAFAEAIWGKENYSSEHFTNGLPAISILLATSHDPKQHLDLASDIEIVERIYHGENELMDSISHGKSARARAIFSNLPLNSFKYETEPLRNLKNFSIISNTLFRKAAEHGGVHPVYVEQLSSAFTLRIEKLTRSDNIFDLWTDMIQKYCALVNNHNTRSYSLPIQKVITRINFDITADLSLKNIAEHLNINASYLSNLFKKETGSTLTNYVNKTRMEHAAFLLSTTGLPISAIAPQCGILDDNYFTKLFRRHYHMTPSHFRDSIT